MNKNNKINKIIEDTKKGIEVISRIVNSRFFKGFNIDAPPKYAEEDIEFVKILFNQCGIVLRYDDISILTLYLVATVDICGIQEVADNLEAYYVQLLKYPKNTKTIKQHPLIKHLIENQKFSEDGNQNKIVSTSVYIKIFISYLQKIINKYDEVKDNFEQNFKKELHDLYKKAVDEVIAKK